MENISVPLIVISCYMAGEIIKYIFKEKEEVKRIIPIIVTILGGVIGIMIYKTSPEKIFNVDSI